MPRYQDTLAPRYQLTKAPWHQDAQVPRHQGTKVTGILAPRCKIPSRARPSGFNGSLFPLGGGPSKSSKFVILLYSDARPSKCHESMVFATAPQGTKPLRYQDTKVPRHPHVQVPKYHATKVPRYQGTKAPRCPGSKVSYTLASWYQDVRFLRARGHLGSMVPFFPLGGEPSKSHEIRDFWVS